MNNEPTIYGMTLQAGMEIEDGVPDCCGEEMSTSSPDKYGDRTHTCRTCGTAVVVDHLGLVDDIHYPATAH